MPFTTVAFYQSVDPAGAYVQLAAPADPHVTVNTPRILVPSLSQVVAVACMLENTVEPLARLVTPSLFEHNRFQLSPINGQGAAAVEPDSPQKVIDLRSTPVPLIRGEGMTCEVSSNPAAAQIQSVIVWLADGPIVPVTGQVYTIRASSSTALVAGTWSNVALTFDEDLPRGRYQVVGFRPLSAGMLAARLVFVGGSFRPGALGVDTNLDLQHPMFRYGGMGVYGEFEDSEPPTVDCLSVSADAAQTFHLDVIQLRKGPG